MAGKSIIVFLLFITSSFQIWSQDQPLRVIHSAFNCEEGTIDLICEVENAQWLHNLTVLTEKLSIEIRSENFGPDAVKLTALKVLPLEFYGADFQPEAIPPKNVVVLFDLGICSKPGSEKVAIGTLQRMIQSRMLGYSPVTLILFDTISQLIVKDVEEESISSVEVWLSKRDSLDTPSDWRHALSGKKLQQYDLYVLLSDDYAEKENEKAADVINFLEEVISPQAEVFPIGAGFHIDTAKFNRIIGITQANDEWTTGGRIPMSLAQTTVSIVDQNAKVVIQCLPDAMNDLDQVAFSYTPVTCLVSFDNHELTRSKMNAGTFLRPAILNHQHSSINRFVTVLMLALAFLFFLVFFLPMRYRYKFKRDHVGQYLKPPDEPRSIDPLTLVQIEDNEAIVYFGHKKMTLETWKKVKEEPSHPVVKQYPEFFDQRFTGYFLGFKVKGFHPVLTAWYGLTGGTVAWAVHELLYLHPFYFMHHLQTMLLDMGVQGWWLELPRAIWTANCLTIGIVGVAVLLRYRRFTLYKLPAFFFILLAAAYMISTSIINTWALGTISGGVIFWLLSGIIFAFSYSIAYRDSILNYIPDALILALGGFVFFEMITYFLLLNTLHLDLQLANLISFALFGWLYAQLSVRETIIHSMAEPNTNSINEDQSKDELISHHSGAEQMIS